MRAKKSLGQNFLADEQVAARIVDAFAPRVDETVLEIGAGRGALTERLLARAGRVVAVELDRGLVPVLRVRFGRRDNFEVIEGDALRIDCCALVAPAASARVIANLPYNVSTAILQRLFAQRRCLPELVLMLQREVVARMIAPPCTPERGYLSLLVEAYADAVPLFDVEPRAFRPVPKVWSTVVCLHTRPEIAPDMDAALEARLWLVVSAGFAQRRKTMLNNLRHAPEPLSRNIEAAGGAHDALARAGIEAQRRAETLTLTEWLGLARTLAN